MLASLQTPRLPAPLPLASGMGDRPGLRFVLRTPSVPWGKTCPPGNMVDQFVLDSDKLRAALAGCTANILSAPGPHTWKPGISLTQGVRPGITF